MTANPEPPYVRSNRTNVIQIVPPPSAEPRPAYAKCTQTEVRVLAELTRDGAANADIGKRLHMSLDTVKTHLKKIGDKTGIHTRTALVAAIYRGTVVIIGPGRDRVEFWPERR